MNYALKLQTSTDFLKTVVTKLNSCSSTDICAHCLHKHINFNTRGRSFSSDVTLIKQIPKRKQVQEKSRKNKRQNNEATTVTELMKVSDYKSKKTTLKICQLGAADVKAFAEIPGMTFEKKRVYKEHISKSTRSQDTTSTCPSKDMKQFVKNWPQEVENCDPMNANTNSSNLINYNIKQKNQFPPNDEVKISNSNGTGVVENEGNKLSNLPDECEYAETELKGFKMSKANSIPKEYEFLKLLKSYIDIATTSNNIDEAYEMLNTCRKRKIWKDLVKILNITDIYNQLLDINTSNWSKICEIRSCMMCDNVSHNYQTYAILLESLGRTKSEFISESYWKSKINQILEEMKQQKMFMNGLFAFTSINIDQCKFILKSIHAVYPKFEIAPSKIKLQSKCSLLKKLNETSTKLESQLKGVITAEELYSCVDRQVEMEKKFTIPVKAIEVDGIVMYNPEEKKRYETWEKKWREQVHQGFIENVKLIPQKNKKLYNIFSLKPYLTCMPHEVYVNAMISSIKALVEYTGGFCPTLGLLHKILGEHIHERYQIYKREKYGIVENTKKIFKKYCDWYLDPVGPAKNSRQQWQLLSQEYAHSYPMDIKEVIWPDSVKNAVGKFLYDIIFKEVKVAIHENQKERYIPVFYVLLRRDFKLSTEEIKCHPLVAKLSQKCGFDYIDFDATQMPMLCPPRPWKALNNAGYMTSMVDFMRTSRELCAKKIGLRKLTPQELYPTFDSLNSLQAVPWRINQPVLDLVLKVFQDGGCNSLGVPEYPNLNSVPLVITPDMTSEQRFLEYRRKKVVMMDKQNKYGLWCEALYRLSLANYFRNDIFWLPQNFDFRGRVYPLPAHLNHIGGDLFRSLLIFAKGKPLGPQGLDWLKIHTINLTGTHKKASNNERLDHANKILPDILDSAANPLDGRRWWTKSDDPWQTLAACMEIKKALDCGNPEEFVTSFPIHQDGSCNGLQHYAALGRDSIGAKSVNLTPCHHPQDVYDAVTQMIENQRVNDAKMNVPMALVLEGYIRRKVVKQTIMTTVYGVTYYGAKLQIAKQLEDISEFPSKYVWPAAEYLTLKTFHSLREMFTSAREIQEWFIQCANVICQQREYVQWVSPLGLPILQPYSKKQEAKKGGKELIVPNSMKQRNAFPPNYIHSLDSTHMMLTAQYCEQLNITFASIHDCYWTHPCSVETMNRICREQFIALHSQPLLKQLSQSFIKRYVKNESSALEVFSRVPKTGDFDLTNVLDSVYFFS